MPILDVTLIADDPADGGLAQRLADAAGAALGSAAGHTWVRLGHLDRRHYAENGAVGPPRALIAEVVRHGWPPDRAARDRDLHALTEGLSEAAGCEPTHVHVLMAPDGGGRISFGGSEVIPLKRHRYASGTPWESRVGYSRAVRVGNQVFVTGTTGTTEDGAHAPADDAYAQAKQALDNIARALAGVGARLDDVVRTRIFVTDIAHDWEAVGRAHAEQLGHVMPATSMLEVRALIAPWMRVEIEADAVVG